MFFEDSDTIWKGDVKMMKAIRIVAVAMLVSVAWMGNGVSAAALVAEDFEGVTAASEVVPAGWIYSIEQDALGGTGDAGTIDVGGDNGAYMRGVGQPTGNGSDHVTMVGIEQSFPIADTLSCTYRIYQGFGVGVTGSWADQSDASEDPEAVVHLMPSGGPFHLPATVEHAQCSDGTPLSTGPDCSGGQERSGTGLFRAIAIIRYWGWGNIGLNCNKEAWIPSSNLLSSDFEMAIKTALDKDSSVEIRVTLEDSTAGNGKKLEWRQGYSNTFTDGPDDIGSSVCDPSGGSTQVAFNTYASGIIIDDVSVENASNVGIPVELGAYAID